MRALVQRVKTGSVTIDGKIAGAIGRGLVILLGIRIGDTAEDVNFVADKCANLRIFEDDDGKFNLSALNIGAEILVISQFTLYGDCRKGRRPSFIDAAPPETSEPLYESFIERIRQQELRTQTGKFGANMLVEIHNDGPVTILVESKNG
jgi:D-tyrosyl-tRNA(Tyr) deacylase